MWSNLSEMGNFGRLILKIGREDYSRAQEFRYHGDCPLAGLEVGFFGRGSRTRRRAARKCAAPVQAEGTAGGHHQGSQASLLLPEAGREEARKGGIGTQAESQEGSQRG